MKKILRNLIQYWMSVSIVSFLGSVVFTVILHFFPKSNCTIIALVFCIASFVGVGLAFITAIIADVVVIPRRKQK